jgi:general secretion pathway protein H
MRILAAGSKVRSAPSTAAQQRGFTLIELLVVISIIAIASAGVAFAMRDSAQTQIEREAQRLSALLEAGRAQSRTRGVAVVWRATAQGFVFDGLPVGTLPGTWLDSNTTVPAGSMLELGPEPIIPAQSVTLGSQQQSAAQWRVGTDGLRPFGLRMADGTGAAP